jgi:3-phosphoshikimate 1-carboxyvinyltransferase
LLAAPRFSEGVEVRHSGPPVPSLPHIEMTLRMLQIAGAEVSSAGKPRPNNWTVRPGRINLGDFTVEPDLSNAGPFLAAALVTGGSVTIADWPQTLPGGQPPQTPPQDKRILASSEAPVSTSSSPTPKR